LAVSVSVGKNAARGTDIGVGRLQRVFGGQHVRALQQHA
jgi:hypothetical protein